MKKKNIVGTTKGKEIIVKDPSIGSGKISRRVFAMYRGHYHPEEQKSQGQKNYLRFNTSRKIPRRAKQPIVTPMFHNPKEKTKKIKFPNEAVRIVFLHWNRLGFPFVKHREIQSKTTAKSLQRLNRAIKQHGKDEVIKAINRCRNLFDQGWFKYRLFFDKQKISLYQFFRYKSATLTYLRRHASDMPMSWFKECVKGNGYLEDRYSVEFKDKNPVVTKRLLDSWKEFDGGEITSKVKNNIVVASRIAKKYAKINKLDINMVTTHIHKMLNEFRVYKPSHSGYLTNSIFWNEKFPKELERYGIVRNRNNLKEVDI